MTTPNTMSDLERMAAEIAGEELAEERTLWKGLAAALLDLVKGKKEETEEKGDDPEDEDKEEISEEQEAGEGGGFEDMRMGTDVETIEEPDHVDATDVVLDLQKSMHTLISQNEAMAARLETLEKAVKDEGQLTRQGVGAVLTPLAKGFSDIDRRLLETPAGSPLDAVDDKAAAVARHMAEQTPSTVHEFTKQKLMKAMAARVISNVELRYYKQHGCFPGSEEDSKATVEKIKALD